MAPKYLNLIFKSQACFHHHFCFFFQLGLNPRWSFLGGVGLSTFNFMFSYVFLNRLQMKRLTVFVFAGAVVFTVF